MNDLSNVQVVPVTPRPTKTQNVYVISCDWDSGYIDAVILLGERGQLIRFQCGFMVDSYEAFSANKKHYVLSAQRKQFTGGDETCNRLPGV